jgi:hypothetical protein
MNIIIKLANYLVPFNNSGLDAKMPLEFRKMHMKEFVTKELFSYKTDENFKNNIDEIVRFFSTFDKKKVKTIDTQIIKKYVLEFYDEFVFET